MARTIAAAALLAPTTLAQPADPQPYPHLGEINVTRNYTAELNAEIEKIPERDRAFLVYRKARIAMEKFPDWDPWPTSPADPTWPQLSEYLRRNAEALRLMHEAARRPRLAAPITHEVDPSYGAPPRDLELADNPPLVNALLPQLGDYRNLLRLLVLDTRVAIHEGDADRVTLNISTMSSLAGHTAESFGLISSLVAISIHARLIDTVDEAIDADTLGFSDSQLATIDQAIAAFDPRKAIEHGLRCDRLVFQDLIQRTFTLDDDGDGVATPRIGAFNGDAGAFLPSEKTEGVGLIMAASAATRRETVAKHDEMMHQRESAVASDPWRPQTWSFDCQTEALAEDGSWRFTMVIITMPAVDKAIIGMHDARTETAAARILIAAERHRRKTGSWPKSLDDLDPAFVESLPRDPFTGDRFIYRLQAGRPLIYSRGPDRDDDATPLDSDRHPAFWLDPKRPNPPDGDWILYPPQP